MMFLEIMERTCKQGSGASAAHETAVHAQRRRGMSGRSAVQQALVTNTSAERDTRRRAIAPHPLTFRSLTEPASSMVKPACIRNTNNAVLLMD
jgi:hypothetical protein